MPRRVKTITGYPLYKCRNCEARFTDPDRNRLEYSSLQSHVDNYMLQSVTIYTGEGWHRVPVLLGHKCSASSVGVADLIGLWPTRTKGSLNA